MATKHTTKLERTPIVAVMGHVDHGKTSFLDAIRNTSVQEGEAGGITQNTRAHQIEYKGQKITFLDTPGHEAFTEMRSRGARFTDIVLLVVAGDDGVQPQTKESIKFAKDAKTSIIVAINKMDLPGFNPDKVKQELSQNDVLVEQYGGDVMTVEISAKQKKNLDEVMESILLQAEVNEIKKSKVAQGTAEAVILESTLDKTKGPISLVLMKSGTINVGDFIVVPGKSTKVRAVLNEFRHNIENAEEGDPVWVIGLDEVLKTGDQIFFEKDQKKAMALAEEFKNAEKTIIKQDAPEAAIAGEDENNIALLAQLLQTQEVEEDIKYLNIVVKTDTQGTLEAVMQKIEELGNDEVKAKILSSGTGTITEKDILTAKNSKGIVIGFQTDISSDAQNVARREKVLVRTYTIIYQLLEEVEAVLNSMQDPEEEIVEVARAEIKKVFTLSDGKKVAGSKVVKGNVIRGYKCLVMRGEEELGNTKISVLKQNKDEVKEVKKGFECGIMFDQNIDFEEGDVIICYKIEKI